MNQRELTVIAQIDKALRGLPVEEYVRKAGKYFACGIDCLNSVNRVHLFSFILHRVLLHAIRIIPHCILSTFHYYESLHF